MTDTALAPAAATAESNPGLLTFELPGIEGEQTFDCASMPADTRLTLLKSATRSYLANRVNATVQRHAKLDTVKAWEAYDAATKADPLQTIVPKPTEERPAAPDLKAALAAALDDLVKGNIRSMGKGTAKPRERKDPLVGMVTKSVVKEVYESNHAVNPKYTYIMAAKEVGPDGVAYLNNLIETKVAAGVDKAALEKMLEERYMKPARLMLGIDTSKTMKDLPSILG